MALGMQARRVSGRWQGVSYYHGGLKQTDPEFPAQRRDLWADQFGEPYWNRERIIRAFQRHAERTGWAPAPRDWERKASRMKPGWRLARPGRPSRETVIAHFGSWSAAVKAAGLADRSARKRPRKRKTHCKHGHALTPENTYQLRGGYLQCRTCTRQRDEKRAESGYWRERYRRQKAAREAASG